MAKIIPLVLKTLRKRKGLSQARLAEKSKLNKQTIWRLENGEDSQEETRSRTITDLAKALSTEESVLTGQAPLPEGQDDDGPFPAVSKLSFPISTDARNALYLMSRRYNVPQQTIVELAPLLFAWAAEASLRQRKDRLDRAEAALNAMKEADRTLEHLQPSSFEELEDKIEQEKQALRYQDIWGMSTEYNEWSGDPWFESPFGVFVAGLAKEIGEDTTFEEFSNDGVAIYRLYPKEAEEFMGDPELGDAVMRGHIALHQMPREFADILNPEAEKKRAEWARSKLDELKRRWLQDIASESAR